MLRTGNIYTTNTEGFDEVWWIVRKPDIIPVIEKYVPELSPSPELFAEYRSLARIEAFDEEYFLTRYVPQFIKDLSKNEEALALLQQLCEKSRSKDILLCCYCDKEWVCHRSIIAGILLGMGAEIETEKSYLKYYDMFERAKMSTADKYEKITKTLIERNMTISTMESCTAGLIASLLTDTEGSSAILKGAFVTYSNMAKIKQGVPAKIIEEKGVYSADTAEAMARACKDAYGADVGIGITGTFGNLDPNNSDSEAGVVYFAIDFKGEVLSRKCTLEYCKSRYEYKLLAADYVADTFLELMNGN